MELAITAPRLGTSGDGAAARCLNCAETLLGPFCAACGQSAATPEHVTFRSLWTDFRINKLGLDRGFLVTIRDVLIRPGVVALAFVEGRRRTYVHPVTFLFVAYAAYAVVFGLVEGPLFAGMEAQMRAQFGGATEMDAAAAQSAIDISLATTRIMVAYGSYVSLLTILPFAALLRRFLPGFGRTVAECVVLAVVIESAVVLVSGLVLNPLSAWTGSFGVTMLSFVSYVGFTALGAAAFFDRRPATIMRAVGAQALAIGLYFVLIMIASGVVGIVIGMRSHGG